MIKMLFLAVFLCIDIIYCSEEQKYNETKQIVCQKITIYTAEGPKDIYHYGLRDLTQEKEQELAEKNKKEKQGTALNEFQKADVLLKTFKDKKIKPKL